MVLAEHFERGGERERARSPGTSAPPSRRSRATTSPRHRRAPSAGVRRRRAASGSARLRLLQAEAHLWRGELAEAEQRATEAAASLPEGGAAWFRAVGEAVAALGRRGLYDRVAAWMEVAFGASPEAARSAHVICLGRGATHLADAGRYDLAEAATARLEALARGAVGVTSSSGAFAVGPGAERADGVPPASATSTSAARLMPTALAQVHLVRAPRELSPATRART